MSANGNDGPRFEDLTDAQLREEVTEIYNLVGGDEIFRAIAGQENDLSDREERVIEIAESQLGTSTVASIANVPSPQEVENGGQDEPGQQQTLGGGRVGRESTETAETPSRGEMTISDFGGEPTEEEEGNGNGGGEGGLERAPAEDLAAEIRDVVDDLDAAETCNEVIDLAMPAARVLVDRQPSPFDDGLEDLKGAISDLQTGMGDRLDDLKCAEYGGRNVFRVEFGRLRSAVGENRQATHDAAEELVDRMETTELYPKWTYADVREQFAANPAPREATGTKALGVPCREAFGKIEPMLDGLNHIFTAKELLDTQQEGALKNVISAYDAWWQSFFKAVDDVDCLRDTPELEMEDFRKMSRRVSNDMTRRKWDELGEDMTTLLRMAQRAMTSKREKHRLPTDFGVPPWRLEEEDQTGQVTLAGEDVERAEELLRLVRQKQNEIPPPPHVEDRHNEVLRTLLDVVEAFRNEPPSPIHDRIPDLEIQLEKLAEKADNWIDANVSNPASSLTDPIEEVRRLADTLDETGRRIQERAAKAIGRFTVSLPEGEVDPAPFESEVEDLVKDELAALGYPPRVVDEVSERLGPDSGQQPNEEIVDDVDQVLDRLNVDFEDRDLILTSLRTELGLEGDEAASRDSTSPPPDDDLSSLEAAREARSILTDHGFEAQSIQEIDPQGVTFDVQVPEFDPVDDFLHWRAVASSIFYRDGVVQEAQLRPGWIPRDDVRSVPGVRERMQDVLADVDLLGVWEERVSPEGPDLNLHFELESDAPENTQPRENARQMARLAAAFYDKFAPGLNPLAELPDDADRIEETPVGTAAVQAAARQDPSEVSERDLRDVDELRGYLLDRDPPGEGSECRGFERVLREILVGLEVGMDVLYPADAEAVVDDVEASHDTTVRRAVDAACITPEEGRALINAMERWLHGYESSPEETEEERLEYREEFAAVWGDDALEEADDLSRWQQIERAHERDVEELGLTEGALPDRDEEG